MRKYVLLGVLASLLLTAGCATMTQTADENYYTYDRAYEHDKRQISYDWQKFWLADRPYRLTQWVTR
jgi:hypothetical protein